MDDRTGLPRPSKERSSNHLDRSPMHQVHHAMPATILCNRRFALKYPKQLTPFKFSARCWEEVAMSTDWRDDDEYDHFDDLGISGLAWECLRRNADYRKEYDLMREGNGAPAHWGLRFPSGSQTQRAQRSCLLAALRSSSCGPPDRLSPRPRTGQRHSLRGHHGQQNRRRWIVMGSAAYRRHSCRGYDRRSANRHPAAA